jgi:hypothetical protein
MDQVSIKLKQNLPLQGLPKFTQIWIFGLKTYCKIRLCPFPLPCILLVLVNDLFEIVSHLMMFVYAHVFRRTAHFLVTSRV